MRRTHPNISQRKVKLARIYRDQNELLLKRVQLLPEQERLLMTMYLEKGLSIKQISRLTGINKGTLSRKVHKIMERLIAGGYYAALQHRGMFSSFELALAKEHYLRGRSAKRIASRYRTSYYETLRILRKIERLRKAAAKRISNNAK